MEAKDTAEHPLMKCSAYRLKLLMRCIAVINKLKKVYLGDGKQQIVQEALLTQLQARFDSLYAGHDVDYKDLCDLEEAASHLLK